MHHENIPRPPYSDRNPPNGSVECRCRWGRQKSLFGAYGLTDCVNAAQQAGVVNAAAGGARPWVQMSVNVGSGWPHNALRHNWLMQISCNFRDCKALLVTSLTHVSGAIASAQTLPFTIQIQRHNFSVPARWNLAHRSTPLNRLRPAPRRFMHYSKCPDLYLLLSRSSGTISAHRSSLLLCSRSLEPRSPLHSTQIDLGPLRAVLCTDNAAIEFELNLK